jgi:hypothetical protein
MTRSKSAWEINSWLSTSQPIYRIVENPWLFSIAANGLRPCLIKRFSYIIHFVVEDDQIIVIAVMNAARDDSSFMHRLP